MRLGTTPVAEERARRPYSPMPQGRRLGRFLLFWLLVWAGFSAVRVLVRVIMLPGAQPAPGTMFLRTLLIQAPWIAASPLIVHLGARLAPHGWRRALATHAVLALALAFVDAAWAHAALHASGARLSLGTWDWFLARADQSVLLYACLAVAGAAWRHWKRILDIERQAARLRSRLLHARLHALSVQLQPHFLFNALNSVSELVHREPARASAMLEALRDLLHRVLADDQRHEVRLSEELALLQAYADIQRVRFTGSLVIRVNVATGLEDLLVPRLLLQPLVENAIRHGTDRHGGRGIITVEAHEAEGHLEIVVRDDGAGLASGTLREGLGLANTRARLHQLHGAEARLELRPGVAAGTEVHVRLPARRTARLLPSSGPAPDATTVPASATPLARPWSWFKVGIVAVLAWLLLALAGASQDWLSAGPDGGVTWITAFGPRLAEAALWIALSPIVAAVSIALARSEWPRWLVIVGLVTAGVLVAALHTMLATAFRAGTMARQDEAALLLYDLAAVTAVVAAAYAWALARLLQERNREAVRVEESLAAERLRALQCRLNPAVIDVTLAHIGALAVESPDAADELTGRFGEQLRQVLQGRQALVALA